MKTILAIIAAAALTGCSPTVLKTTFAPAEASYINQTGKGSINGQAFLRRNDGIVVYGAGSEVDLIPATAYARERMASIYGGGKYAVWHAGFKNDDPAYQSYMKKTVADGEGRFKFENLADGTYFITTTVTWFVQYQQGGALMESVTISGGQPVQVIMSGQ
jgi:hypothetical protein